MYTNTSGNKMLNQVYGSPFYETCDDGKQCTDGTDCTTGGGAVCVGIGDGSCLERNGNGCSATCQIESCTDNDYDGYGTGAILARCRKSTTVADCNDFSAAANPGMSETSSAACTDTLDNDCDGSADALDIGCSVCG